MQIAYSYVRFSSDAQKTGDSVRRQIELAENYAREHGLTLDTHSYRDLGISAFKARNAAEGALGAFLKAVDEGAIPSNTTLLVESLDRISRASVSVAQPLFMSIINRGVTIVTLIDGQVFTKEKIDADGGMSLLWSMMLLIRAHEESATKARRVKASLAAARVAKKVTRNCPAWLLPNAARTEYDLVHEKVAVVRKVFEMAGNGMGMYTIYQHLNAERIPQLGAAKNGWAIPAVGRLLHNQAVIGRLVSVANDEIIEDFYPAIIGKDTFYEIQEQIELRNSRGKGRKGDGVANLFSGLNRCGDCNAPMRFLRIPSGANINSYLKCVDALEKKGCTAPRLNYDMLEWALLHYFFQLRAVDAGEAAHDPLPELRALLNEKQQQIERLIDTIESAGASSRGSLAARLLQREREAAELRTKIRDSGFERPSVDVWREASLMFERVLCAEGDDRVQLRRRVGSVLQRIVESIHLPSKIITQNKTRMRRAIIKWRGDWDDRLLTRDFVRDGLPVDMLTKTQAQDGVAFYALPEVGGSRSKGSKVDYRYRSAPSKTDSAREAPP